MSNYKIQVLLNLYKRKFNILNQTLKNLVNNSVSNKYNTGHDFIQDPDNAQTVHEFGWSDGNCPNLMKIFITLKAVKNEVKLNYNNFLSRNSNKKNN